MSDITEQAKKAIRSGGQLCDGCYGFGTVKQWIAQDFESDPEGHHEWSKCGSCDGSGIKPPQQTPQNMREKIEEIQRCFFSWCLSRDSEDIKKFYKYVDLPAATDPKETANRLFALIEQEKCICGKPLDHEILETLEAGGRTHYTNLTPQNTDWEQAIRDKWQALDNGKTVTRSGIRPTLLDEFIEDIRTKKKEWEAEAARERDKEILASIEKWKSQGRDEHDLWAMNNWLSGSSPLSQGETNERS